MSHQEQLEKKKYRNWVRGGLAYKYLNEGIKGFADDVVQREHMRINQDVISGRSCTQCSIENLRPLHKCEKNPTGKNKCPLSQNRCNCLYTKKKPCPHNVCDAIMEEILKTHGSAPPTPYWKNTDIKKWCSDPWEIAKCFINAPGYFDKSKADDIDTPGLIHVFINNIQHMTHLSDTMNKGEIFQKTLQRRNELFHSPTMEMEDTKLDECIDDIIAILEDEKELKARNDAQKAVIKLTQLKQDNFIITTHNDAEVCRDALASVTNKAEELKQTIEDAKDDIAKKQAEVTEDTRKILRDALGESDNQTVTLYQRVCRLESDDLDKNQRLSLLESKVENLESKVEKLEIVRQNHQKQLHYVQGKQALQNGLVELYQQHYVKTSISPLKSRENKISINEVYVEPNMAVEEQTRPSDGGDRKGQTRSPERRYIHGYRELFQTDGQKRQSIYIVGDVGTGKSSFCKMMIQNWCTAITDNSVNVATGSKSFKSTEPKTGATCKEINESDTDDKDLSSASELDTHDNIDYLPSNTVGGNIKEMRNFDFLFFVPMQKMSGISDITEMIKAIVTDAGLGSNYVIDEILDHESEHCLIVADGLDEWTVPKDKSRLQHVSYGLPKTDRVKYATVITLSRPSAKGILNLKYSECDNKVELLGIEMRAVNLFIQKYTSKSDRKDVSLNSFMEKIKSAKLKHLEKTPLLLQQMLWLHCNGNEIGKSMSDTYSHIINIMLGWTQSKEEEEDKEEDQTGDKNEDKDENLPGMLQRFDRCEENKRFILPLARVAFEALNSETMSNTFGRRHLRKRGVSHNCITTLKKIGILIEENCFDPTKENTRLAFIHISYLEFFAAIHVSSQCYNDKFSKPQYTILKDLFRNCKSAADILQLSNVLKMICGLYPYIISELSKNISDIVFRDEKMITYRNSIPISLLEEPVQELEQIQSLMLNCLSEGKSDDHLMFSLYDVILYPSTKISLLQRIIPENVLYLYVWYNPEAWKGIEQLKQLQYLHLNDIELSHSDMVLLSSFIQELPLTCLSLFHVCCHKYKCQGHMIDLSKQNQLQKLQLNNCHKLIISNINTEQLEVLHLDSSDTLDINLLIDASSLSEIQFGCFSSPSFKYNKQVGYVVHTLNQLRTIRLFNVDIDINAPTVTSEMRNIAHIRQIVLTRSKETWRTFVDSLLTLQQSVQSSVRITRCTIDKDEIDYIKQHESFEFMERHDIGFTFRTKK